MMTNTKEDQFDPTAMADTWMKSMGNFWEQALDQSRSFLNQDNGGPEEDDHTGNGGGFKTQENMMAALKNWQTMANAMMTPDSMAAIMKGSSAMPEILLKLAQSSTSSVLELQQKMIKHFDRVGESAEAYRFDDIDENLFRLSTDIYEKEFRKFFNIPQLGLLRTYQEKANMVVDKFNLFQSRLSELLRLLGLPFHRTLKVMQEELGQMAEKGEIPEDPQVYYRMWVRILEGHFMTIFQTSEYVETLGGTINSMSDFAVARDAALEDLLSFLPVATRTEMDDIARDLYELKKRIRKIEKKEHIMV